MKKKSHPPIWIKVCGLSTQSDVAAAVDAGADAIGFVFAPGSPRTVTPQTALSASLEVPPEVEKIGVFRNQSLSDVVSMSTDAGIRCLQLHGNETPHFFAEARKRGFDVIRAVSAESQAHETASERAQFQPARLLLDAATPGGGAPFDPALDVERWDNGDWILAGGLTARNVRTLIDRLRPSGVDVSSGVERSRGIKDPALIREFVDAVRHG
ncbi:phosphoribosylanthranilate isomerase [Mycetocola sp.]|uniref:phosphoribosylanthranilate isomerase n=1 Tax=Mycetocola sp. TaxID=1871042 RepID=UPI0039892E96